MVISLKVKEQSSELFFVQVKEPNEARRNILETLREIVEVLKRFERFKHIRHEKLESIHKLRSLLKDANKMLGNLRAKLPQTNLRATLVREAQPKKAHKKTKKRTGDEKPETSKKEMTELEKLEAELGAIESKLKSLS